jgi:hypothetical protein
LFHAGIVPSMPVLVRPSFAAIYGYSGNHHFGANVLPTFDDFATLYRTDAALAAFIQSGMGRSDPAARVQHRRRCQPPCLRT